MRVRNVTWRLVAWCALVASFQLACEDDAGPIPAVHEEFDFESGLAGWVADTAFVSLPPGETGAYSLEIAESGVEGMDSACALLSLDNITGIGMLWLVREYTGLEADRYGVELSARVAPAQNLSAARHAVVAITTHRPRPMESSLGDFQDLGPIGYVDPPQSPTDFAVGFEGVVDVGGTGFLWVAIGYRATYESDNQLCIDDVNVRALRR